MADVNNGQPDLSIFGALMQNANQSPWLDRAAKMTDIANAQNQMKLFQATYGAKQAIGQVMQNSLDPQTGQIDPVKWANGIQSLGPAAGFVQPEITAQQGMIRQQLEMKGVNIANAAKKLNIMTPMVSGVLSKQNLSKQDILDAYEEGRDANPDVFSTQDEANFSQALSKIPDNDPSLRQFVQRYGMSSDQGMKTIAAVQPSWQMKNNGKFNYLQNLNPLAATPVGATTAEIPQQLTPSESIGMQPAGVDSSGAQQIRSGAQAAIDTNQPELIQGNPGTKLGANENGTVEIEPLPQPKQFGGSVAGGLAPQAADYKQQFRTERGDLDAMVRTGDFSNISQQSLEKDLQSVQAGRYEPVRADLGAKIKSFALAIGVPEEKASDFADKIAGGSLADAQAATKTFVVNNLPALQAALGSVIKNKAEFQTALETLQNLSTDPNAIQTMIGLSMKIQQAAISRQDAMYQFEQGGLPFQGGKKPALDDYGAFEPKYQQMLQGGNAGPGGVNFALPQIKGQKKPTRQDIRSVLFGQ